MWRHPVADHFHRFALCNLKKAGRCARRRAVHVPDVERRGFPLRRDLPGIFGQTTQIAHLLVG
jgi:hypothetical protein